MFNKSTLFNRNDPPPRREAGTGTGTTQPSGTAQASAARPATGPSEGTPGRSGAPVKDTPASPAGMPVSGTQAPQSPVPKEKEKTAPDTEQESTIGARLIVGPDVKLKGAEILDCDTLVVEGRVEATMDSRVIRIAERGAFIGKVSIDVAEIHGSFEGELTARSQLIIHSTGRVTGTIRYGKLVADEGCELCGDVNVLSPASTAKAKTGPEPAVLPDVAG